MFLSVLYDVYSRFALSIRGQKVDKDKWIKYLRYIAELHYLP